VAQIVSDSGIGAVYQTDRAALQWFLRRVPAACRRAADAHPDVTFFERHSSVREALDVAVVPPGLPDTRGRRVPGLAALAA
jgi:hypothetical protein